MVQKEYIESLSDEDFVNFTSKMFLATDQGLTRYFKYRMTNRDTAKLNTFCGELGEKRILAASGSSIPLLSFLEQKESPKLVYGFDYSPKQVAYNYLLKNAVKHLDFAEFLDFFGYYSKKPRNRKNKLKRHFLVGQVPQQLRKYIPNNHELTLRDLKLRAHANCSFFSNEHSYNLVKSRVGKIKYFVFNLNPIFRQDLSKIFPKNYFNFIYLSNVLDWICWHNKISFTDLAKILKMLESVSQREATVVIDHLLTRATPLPKFLLNRNIVQESSYSIYTYNWRMYKLEI